jgi:hypothetical protein
LHAIEEQDTQGGKVGSRSTFLTGKVKEDEMIVLRTFFFILAYLLNTMGLIVFRFFNFIFSKKVQDVGAEKDAIIFLRAPTHYGKLYRDVSVVSPVLFYLWVEMIVL